MVKMSITRSLIYASALLLMIWGIIVIRREYRWHTARWLMGRA